VIKTTPQTTSAKPATDTELNFSPKTKSEASVENKKTS
jgi:hypothetical protein